MMQPSTDPTAERRACPVAGDGTPDYSSGAVLPLLAGVLFTVLAVVGLAIDSGNLFHSSMLLQKAIDAGALAGAKHIAITGRRSINASSTSAAAFKETVKTVAGSMLVRNLLIRRQRNQIGGNAAGDPLRYTVEVDLSEDTVAIRAEWTVDLYLLKYLPGYPVQSTIRLQTKAQVQPAIVSVLLDSSGNMLCPADGSDCSCKPFCQASGISTKVTRMKTAVSLFVTQFNPDRDMIQLAYFSTGAATYVPILVDDFGRGHFDFSQLELAITNYPVQGDTNQSAALLEGYLGTRRAVSRNGGRRNIAYVLMSDAAPTAARFFFANPAALPPHNPFGQTFSSYDYYSWWDLHRDPADPAPLNQPATLPLISGVSVLSKGGEDYTPWWWSDGDPPGPTYDNATNPATGGSMNEAAVPCSVKDPRNPAAAFQFCLNDFSFYTPTLAETGSARRWDSGYRNFTDFWEQYYNAAIAFADFLRDDGGIVYTIGLGFSAAGSATDPYQNVSDSESRKDTFFGRLANDPLYSADPGVRAAFPREYVAYIAESSSPSYLSEGAYAPLDNALSIEQEFDKLFDRIVRKIKTVQLIK